MTIEFNWDLDFADLSVKGRSSEGEYLSLWDVDAGPGGLTDGNVGYNANDQVDVVLNSKSDQAIRWTLGYYNSDSWDEDDNNGTYLWAMLKTH